VQATGPEEFDDGPDAYAPVENITDSDIPF
jgi:hypothetical protein